MVPCGLNPMPHLRPVRHRDRAMAHEGTCGQARWQPHALMTCLAIRRTPCTLTNHPALNRLHSRASWAGRGLKQPTVAYSRLLKAKSSSCARQPCECPCVISALNMRTMLPSIKSVPGMFKREAHDRLTGKIEQLSCYLHVLKSMQ